MSDPTPEPTTPIVPVVPPVEASKPTQAEPVKAETDLQAEVEKWKAFSRKHEDAAKANADKAKQFDAFEESQKTEQQKLTDKAAKAEAEAATTRGELAVMRAAVKHGLSADDLELLGTHGTPEEIDSRAEKLAARLATAAANKPPVDFGGGARGTDVRGGPNFESLIAEATKSGNFTRVISLKEQQHAHLTKPKS